MTTPQDLPRLGFSTKLWNRKTQRYFIVDGLGFAKNNEIDKVGLLDLSTRIRVWRTVEEVNQLMQAGALEEWRPIDKYFF